MKKEVEGFDQRVRCTRGQGAVSFGDWLGLVSWTLRSKCRGGERKEVHKRMGEVGHLRKETGL